jgi:hypothetical protein
MLTVKIAVDDHHGEPRFDSSDDHITKKRRDSMETRSIASLRSELGRANHRILARAQQENDGRTGMYLVSTYRLYAWDEVKNRPATDYVEWDESRDTLERFIDQHAAPDVTISIEVTGDVYGSRREYMDGEYQLEQYQDEVIV